MSLVEGLGGIRFPKLWGIGMSSTWLPSRYVRPSAVLRLNERKLKIFYVKLLKRLMKQVNKEIRALEF